MNTLMLLDTYGLVYRAFFALPPLTTTRGLAINAAYGFTMMVNKIIADEKPSHVIACFDKGSNQARKERFPDYKAQRTETPDDLRPQFALVRRILETMKIPILELAGQEADDVIATLAHQATLKGERTLVVTGDLDLLQIINPQVTALVTRRGITDLSRYDEAAVRERFSLEPGQLADYRGLKGDPSDNLPGIPGVGEKTASKLIGAAGSLDALLANPKLAGTPKLQKLVEEYGEQARACRDVSVIQQDLDLSIDWEAAAYSTPDPNELYKLYHELEFKTLLNKLEVPTDAPPPEAPDLLQGSWTRLSQPEELPPLLANLETRAVALTLFGEGELGLSCEPDSGVGFPLAWLAEEAPRAAWTVFWEGCDELICFDAKQIVKIMDARGFVPRPPAEDPMVGCHLLDPSRSFTAVADAAGRFLQAALPDEPGAWAAAALRLAPVVRELLAETSQGGLYAGVETPLTALLARMERLGVAIDPTELTVISGEIEATASRLQTEIYELAGETFNIGSVPQLGAILFDKLKLPGGKRNKTGWATGVEVLQALRKDHPIASKILEYREVTKLKNTYVDVIPKLTEADGRLRTQFNQTSTATGRLSSANPNLQNIPVRSELGRRIRRAFVAPPGRQLLAADYSQIELRLMAHLSGDESMCRAFREGQDIHDFTARQIFSVEVGEVTDGQRRVAKSVNFGLLYGMSDFGLAQRLGIGRAEAKTMTEAYFARFPSVRAFIHEVLEGGRQNGYVSTVMGRRRYMPALRSSNYLLRSAAEREATNAPIQGSAADLMKLAMVKIDEAMGKAALDASMLLQIHDELIFEVADADVARTAELVRHEMEGALKLQVPIEATVKTGANWYDVQSYDADEADAESLWEEGTV